MPEEETLIAEYHMSGWLDHCYYELFTKRIRMQGGRRTGNQFDVTVMLVNLQPRYSVVRYVSPITRAGVVFLGLLTIVFLILFFPLNTPPWSKQILATELLILVTSLLILLNWRYTTCYAFSYASGLVGVSIFDLGPERDNCKEFAETVANQIRLVQTCASPKSS